VVGDSLEAFQGRVQLHFQSKMNSRHKHQGSILRHQVVFLEDLEGSLQRGKVEREAGRRAALAAQPPRQPHCWLDGAFLAPSGGGCCRGGRRLLGGGAAGQRRERAVGGGIAA
jgi:hypothetical protein